MTKERAEQVTNEIMDLYENLGGKEYAGEKVTQLEHMVQAAGLAQRKGSDEDVVLAAFLHDIGHLCESPEGTNGMEGFGIVNHEQIGAVFLLERGFSQKIIRLVESHVDAKRYLTFSNPTYFDKLSEASKKTFAYQGGKMSREEAEAFRKDPLFSEIIQMRTWDDEAKIQNLGLPPLRPFRAMIYRHLVSQ